MFQPSSGTKTYIARLQYFLKRVMLVPGIRFARLRSFHHTMNTVQIEPDTIEYEKYWVN